MAKASATASKPSGKVRAPSKSEVLNNIAAATNLSRKEVAAVLEALCGDINKSIGKKGQGVYQIPGLCKIVRKQNPARPAREGTDPRTGEKVMLDRKSTRLNSSHR